MSAAFLSSGPSIEFSSGLAGEILDIGPPDQYMIREHPGGELQYSPMGGGAEILVQMKVDDEDKIVVGDMLTTNEQGMLIKYPDGTSMEVAGFVTSLEHQRALNFQSVATVGVRLTGSCTIVDTAGRKGISILNMLKDIWNKLEEMEEEGDPDFDYIESDDGVLEDLERVSRFMDEEEEEE